ncbi:MAG TPA: histidine phosphatase family protein, partial [Dongiaceae bacterium]|nr:histidine phosphatase family protein [Dongiaceae bacterium]
MTPAAPDATHLILVRHGQIQANIDKLWHGWTDSALTEEGHRQAERAAARIAAEHPDIRAIYASPLQRAFNTAQKIANVLGLEVVPEPRLKEYGIGILEGVSFGDLHREHNFFQQIDASPDYAPEGGESITQVSERVHAAIRDLQQRHAGEKILAVSHGAALALVLAKLFDQ